MQRKNLLDDFPNSIPVDRSAAHVYLKSNKMFAVFGDEPVPGGKVDCVLQENPAVTIYHGQPDRDSLQNSACGISPVYQVDGKGPPVVPTGRVLVRIAESARIEDFEDELDSAAYQLQSPLAYAPHAGWVTAKSGNLLDAINGLEDLGKTPGVVHCELQMLQATDKK